MSKSNFKDNRMNGDILMPMTRTQESLFLLDLVAMRNAQLNDDALLLIVRKHIAENKEDSIYTYKDVEDVKLTHKANKILVPKSKQHDMLD